MSKTENNHWTDQKVTIYLSTPLSPLGSQDVNSADVFLIQATVLDQVGSGLMLDISGVFDQNHQPSKLNVKKIFLPFSKVDYISIP